MKRIVCMCLCLVFLLLCSCRRKEQISVSSQDPIYSDTELSSTPPTVLSAEQVEQNIDRIYQMVKRHASYKTGEGLTDSDVVEIKELLSRCDNIDTSTDEARFLDALVKCYRQIYNFYLQNGSDSRMSQSYNYAVEVYDGLPEQIKQQYEPLQYSDWKKASENFKLFGFRKSGF